MIGGDPTPPPGPNATVQEISRKRKQGAEGAWQALKKVLKNLTQKEEEPLMIMRRPLETQDKRDPIVSMRKLKKRGNGNLEHGCVENPGTGSSVITSLGGSPLIKEVGCEKKTL